MEANVTQHSSVSLLFGDSVFLGQLVLVSQRQYAYEPANLLTQFSQPNIRASSDCSGLNCCLVDVYESKPKSRQIDGTSKQALRDPHGVPFQLAKRNS